MAVFTFRMPAGIPGAVNRVATATIEAQQLDTTYFPTVYGVPVALDATSHNLRAIKAADTASSVYGFYVRPYPATGNGTDGLGTSTPPVSGVVSVLKRGYMMVKLNGTTAAVKNGTVYVRTVTGTFTVIGGIEALADSTNTFAMTGNTYFTGPADSNGNVEVAFNI
jgi:hypothetical protein